VEVLSCDHVDLSWGRYFNFDVAAAESAHGGTLCNGCTHNIKNTRTNREMTAYIWTSVNGGSVGNGHGRWTDEEVSWQMGDKFTFTDRLYVHSPHENTWVWTMSGQGNGFNTNGAVGRHDGAGYDYACDACPAGQHQPSTGQTGCSSCPCGHLSSASQGACSTCPSGQVSGGGASSCSSCSAGYYGPINACGCTYCSPGHYQPSANQPSCIVCPVGQYQPSHYGTSCILCPSGHYMEHTGYVAR
jgi:hypothetical protein